mgnify:CR=1 FL=1
MSATSIDSIPQLDSPYDPSKVLSASGVHRVLPAVCAARYSGIASELLVGASESDERHTCECSASYSGVHARGNLRRHRRVTGHGVGQPQEKVYPCEVTACGKSYKRQDARLRHYRVYHKDLARPAMARGKGFKSLANQHVGHGDWDSERPDDDKMDVSS